MRLGDIASFEYGFTETAKDTGDYRFIRITDIDDIGRIQTSGAKYIDATEKSSKFLLKFNDILVARTGSYGKTTIFKGDYKAVFASYLIRITLNTDVILPEYYWFFAQTDKYWKQANMLVGGTSQPQFNANVLCDIQVEVPSLEIQQEVIDKLNHELDYIKQTEQIIASQNQKIKDVLNSLWKENSKILIDEPVADKSVFDVLIRRASKPLE